MWKMFWLKWKRFLWLVVECFVVYPVKEIEHMCLKNKWSIFRGELENTCSQALVNTLAVFQEFVLIFYLFWITWKGQCARSEFYNENVNNFLLLSRKEVKGNYESSIHKICALNWYLHWVILTWFSYILCNEYLF